jgi:hypothetical protein
MTCIKRSLPFMIVVLLGVFLVSDIKLNERPRTGTPQSPPDNPAPVADGKNPAVVAAPPRVEPEELAQQPRLALNLALAMGTAVEPKPLSGNVKKGLEYLVGKQHENGGWGQGGGWRVATQGGRVEGADVQDPPDVGNTCLAVLALIRAGNTPKQGPYAKNVAKGVEFICSHIENSDGKSLYVTDIKGTQLQSKIGVYVDTFLSSMVLAELKGRMQDESSEKRMVAALTKTVRKMEAHQQTDGTFAGNVGWAPVLSQGLANKGFARASQNGVEVADMTFANVQKQVAANFDGTGKSAIPATAPATISSGAGGLTLTSSAGPVVTGGLGGGFSATDAGVAIYNVAANVSSAADVTNTYRKDEQKAREVLAKKDAPAADKAKATATLKNIERHEKVRGEATAACIEQLDKPGFIQGFGSNGGEEFLSYMNISEAILLKGGDDWKKWDKTITECVSRVQDGDGSWSGQHCITGRTACTAAALLVLMADRAPVPLLAANNKTQK